MADSALTASQPRPSWACAPRHRHSVSSAPGTNK
ncbi:hypothetical protein LEMLEM_LOCUS9471, partial [Lemmus lemmus]